MNVAVIGAGLGRIASGRRASVQRHRPSRYSRQMTMLVASPEPFAKTATSSNREQARLRSLIPTSHPFSTRQASS